MSSFQILFSHHNSPLSLSLYVVNVKAPGISVLCPESCEKNDHFYCHCDIICTVFGDCCQDSVGISLQQTSTVSNMIPDAEFWSCVHVPTQYVTHQWLLLVNKCPKGCDSLVSERCASLRNESILTNGFGVYYANAFCAMCHGHSNTSLLQEYAIYATCVDYAIGRSFISHNCFRILSIDNSNNLPRQCDDGISTNDIIDHCPNKSDSNSSINLLCEQHSAFIYVNTTLYKNKYCALCNGAVDLFTTNVLSCDNYIVVHQGDTLTSPPEPHLELPLHGGLFITYKPVAFLQPICAIGTLLNDNTCLPEDADWPPCEHMSTSYAVNYSYPVGYCFKGVGTFNIFIFSTDVYDIFNNTIFTYEMYDVYDAVLPNKTEIERMIVNEIEGFNSSFCSENVITLIQSCLVSGSNSSLCMDNWFNDTPDAFQSTVVNGTNYIYHSGSYIVPIKWENLTQYTIDRQNSTISIKREFRLCGPIGNIMDCAVILIEKFEQVTEDNLTFLIVEDSYIYPNDYVLLPNGSAHVCWTSYSDYVGSFYQRFSRAQIITSHVMFGWCGLWLTIPNY